MAWDQLKCVGVLFRACVPRPPKALASVALGVALGPPRLPLASLGDTARPVARALAACVASQSSLPARSPSRTTAVAVGTASAAAGPETAIS